MAFHQSGAAHTVGRIISLDRPSPVKLACQSCRTGHQKCDGCLPICSRCKKEQKACDYTPSRRGRNVAHLHRKQMKASKSNNIDEITHGHRSGASTYFSTALEGSFVDTSDEPLNETSLVPLSHERALLDPPENFPVIDSYHLSCFYNFFWPAHPFLPPKRYLPDHLERSGDARLGAAIDFIGQKYAGSVAGSSANLEPTQDFSQYPRDEYSVQTLILVAISHHMCNERDSAKMALAMAADIALSIGLDRENFATDHGDGNSIIEDSWRRTWWELYTIEALFAAINQGISPRLNDVDLEVQLPCEEEIYRCRSILPKSQNLHDFDSRFFDDDSIKYSSFTYRIAAARTLRKIISSTRNQGNPGAISRKEVELEMENLILHLPNHMEICIDSEGAINEVTFQAHMIMHAATIYLHRPQSLLASPESSYTIACAPNGNAGHVQHTHHHTQKAVNAANEICHLITMSSALLAHSPFFICAVAMQAIVHLGIYSVPSWAYNQKLAEEQIKMSIGVLRKLGEVWEIAYTVRQDVKNVAKALLNVSKTSRVQKENEKVNPDVGSSLSPPQMSIEDGLPLGIEAKSQSNDDSWIDEFLAVNAIR